MNNRRTAQEINFLQSFGNRLEGLRVKRGFTQEELAAEAGFSRSYYTEIETGKRNISLLNLRKLARCLQVSLSELLDLDPGDTNVNG
jgi:transcriptional regulator with XRE-family HTH domain